MPKLSFQKGYISLLLIIFLLLFAVLVQPKNFSPTTGSKNSSGCVVGGAPQGEEILRGLPSIKDKDTYDSTTGPILIGQPIGGPDPNKKTDYILIRKNVLFINTENHIYHILGPEDLLDVNTHTVKVTFPVKSGYDAYYPKYFAQTDLPGKGKISLMRQGVILLVKNGPGAVIYKDGNDIYTADVYQDINIYNLSDKGYTSDQFFECNTAFKPTVFDNVTIPDQKKSSTKDQLQLEWFAFNSGATWDIHCKPAVYLYPPQEELVNVKVEPSGYLTYTDPVYDSKLGWNVMAYPTGQLFNISKEAYHLPLTAYSYLYFESKIRDEVIKKPEKGWVVKYSELDNLYKDILPKLGLNPQQTKDFMEYWDKALDKTSPYYFVGVIDQNNVNQIEKLEITPKPDYINRVRIYFERLDNYKQVEAPQLTPYRLPLTANSFRVVEWGGMVKNDPSHPFTCSQ